MDASKGFDECPLCSKVIRFSSEKLGYYWETEHLFVALGDHAFFEGYSVIILKEHRTHYDELSEILRLELCNVQAHVGKVLRDVYGCYRLNYACLGNQVEHLHWHIFPRYLSEPDRLSHPWKHQDDFNKHVLSVSEYSRQSDRLALNCKQRLKD